MKKEDIGLIIKEALKKKGIKQKEFSEKIGESIGVVNKWVNGKACPPGDKLIKLINILEIQDDIFPRKNDNLSEKIRETEEKYAIIEKLQRVESAEKLVQEDVKVLKEVVQRIAKHMNLNIHIEKNKVCFDGNTFNSKKKKS